MVYLGLPIKNGWIFHGYVSHNQRVYSKKIVDLGEIWDEIEVDLSSNNSEVNSSGFYKFNYCEYSCGTFSGWCQPNWGEDSPNISVIWIYSFLLASPGSKQVGWTINERIFIAQRNPVFSIIYMYIYIYVYMIYIYMIYIWYIYDIYIYMTHHFDAMNTPVFGISRDFPKRTGRSRKPIPCLEG